MDFDLSLGSVTKIKFDSRNNSLGDIRALSRALTEEKNKAKDNSNELESFDGSVNIEIPSDTGKRPPSAQVPHNRRQVSFEEAYGVAQVHGLLYVETSATNGFNVSNTFQELTEVVYER